jgi:hypothetical protein
VPRIKGPTSFNKRRTEAKHETGKSRKRREVVDGWGKKMI